MFFLKKIMIQFLPTITDSLEQNDAAHNNDNYEECKELVCNYAVFYPNCVHITLIFVSLILFLASFQHVFVVSIMDTINDVLMNV